MGVNLIVFRAGDFINVEAVLNVKCEVNMRVRYQSLCQVTAGTRTVSLQKGLAAVFEDA